MSNEKLREALQSLVDIIDAAGLLNLSDGVLFNQTAWYVKASDIMIEARQALATPAASSQPSKYGSPELQALIVAHATQSQEPAAPQGFATLNEWFLSLPEQRQAQLRDDKWMLANAAFMANRTAAPSQPVTLTDGLIEKGAMTGMVDAQIDAIIAALREKEQAK